MGTAADKTINGSDPDLDPVPGGASDTEAARSRDGGCLVILGQACHLPVEPLDLPLQDFVLRAQPLDALPQGFVAPCFAARRALARLRRAAARRRPARSSRRCSVSYCSDNLFKAARQLLVPTRSYSSLTRLDSFNGGPVVAPHQAGIGPTPRAQWQYHVPLPLDLVGARSPKCPPPVPPASSRACSIRPRSAIGQGLDPVLGCCSTTTASSPSFRRRCRAKDPGRRSRGRSHALSQQFAHPPGRLLRIALDCTAARSSRRAASSR